MLTLVEVYAVAADNSTGSFVGFGTLLDPTVVFLHPAKEAPPQRPIDPGSRPGPLRPGPLRPGPFRPAFPVEPTIARPLHDEPEQRPAGRARCRIRSGLSVLTLDGVFLPAPAGLASAPRSVQLNIPYAGDVDQLQVPQGPGHPTAEEAAEAVSDLLLDAALDDPATPLSPPPTGPDVDGQRPHPGRRPWYCVICPGAWGC